MSLLYCTWAGWSDGASHSSQRLTYEVNNMRSGCFCMMDINYKPSECVCACIPPPPQTENWRSRGGAAAFGGAEQHPGDETGETQPTGKAAKLFLRLFPVMDLLVWHKGPNLITLRAAAWSVWQCRLIHTNTSHIWQFFKHNWTQVWLRQRPIEDFVETCGWFKVLLLFVEGIRMDRTVWARGRRNKCSTFSSVGSVCVCVCVSSQSGPLTPLTHTVPN